MDNKDKYTTLVLVTDSFPFGGITEQMFVMPEIEPLSKSFSRVVIMPTIERASQYDLALPRNVEVSRYWVDYPDWRSRLRRARYIFSRDTWRSVKSSMNYASLTYAIASKAFSKAIIGWMKREKLEWDTTLFYTFWFDIAASGLALISQKHEINYFMRAHGHDIYMNRAGGLRQLTARKAKRIYTAGKSGADYLKKLYPDLAEKIEQRRLGSYKPESSRLAGHHAVTDKEVVILSVSRVVEIKRVDLNYRFLRALAIARPSTAIRWIHIGGGPLYDELKGAVEQDLPSNLTVELRGELPNEAVHEIYKTEKIDWFMLLSKREGLPIAICEALSYGVPVVATDVEGSGEAVDDKCGVLLARDPEPEEFVRGIVPYLDSEFRMEQLRHGAYHRWQTRYDASKLREEFANEIKNL